MAKQDATNCDDSETESPATGSRRFISLCKRRGLLTGLITLALIYQGLGYFILLTGTTSTLVGKQTTSTSDLRLRWLEAQTIWRGHALALNQGRYVAIDEDLHDLRQEDGRLQPRAKVPYIGGYPPWAFFFGSVVLWADWPTSRVMFGLLNIAATVVLAYWAWGAGRRIDLATARLCLCAALALSAHLNILVRGQMGTIIVAAVIVVGWGLDRGRIFSSGLMLSIVMAKPTMGFTFLIHFVCRRAWLPLIVMSLILLGGSTVILSLSGCTPWQALHGLEDAGIHAFRQAPSAETIIIQAGLDPRLAVIMLGLLGVFLCWVLMQRFARGAWLEQLAMAAVIGRLAAYHRPVDNVMVVFLLVLLAVRAGEEPRNRWLAWLFLAVGVSLWVPVRANWILPHISTMVVWPAALAAVLIHQDRAERTKTASL